MISDFVVYFWHGHVVLCTDFTSKYLFTELPFMVQNGHERSTKEYYSRIGCATKQKQLVLIWLRVMGNAFSLAPLTCSSAKINSINPQTDN